jgi:hypothetical protein
VGSCEGGDEPSGWGATDLVTSLDCTDFDTKIMASRWYLEFNILSTAS